MGEFLTMAQVMAAKADEHDRIEREIREAKNRAENALQINIAKRWVKENATNLIAKIEVVAIRGGRSYSFSLKPDNRYSDCSGAWYTTLNELQTYMRPLGFTIERENNNSRLQSFTGQVVTIFW